MAIKTEYTNCISLEQMEYLDLFDNIPYKVVKKIVKMDDDTDFQVEIKDLPHDDYNKCFTSFKFTLEIDISQGSLPLMVEKHYCVIKEYVGSSPMAMFIGENLTIEVEEEEEEECDDCEGKCRADETEKCDNCAVELRIGCGNKPSDHSIFNGLCDDCREEEEEEEEEYAVILTDENGEVLKKSNDEDESSEEEDEEEKHECELCKKHVDETEYLPSKEDEEKQQILGNDYCLECYKKVEKFEFVENIDLDK
jgi:hypothetical protein